MDWESRRDDYRLEPVPTSVGHNHSMGHIYILNIYFFKCRRKVAMALFWMSRSGLSLPKEINIKHRHKLPKVHINFLFVLLNTKMFWIICPRADLVDVKIAYNFLDREFSCNSSCEIQESWHSQLPGYRSPAYLQQYKSTRNVSSNSSWYGNTKPVGVRS